MEKMLPLPINEKGRLKQLKDYGILDTLEEKEYDNITKLASHICQTEIALISLLDEERQWFKSRVGLDAEQTAREISFCQYAIMDDQIYEVENAIEDPLFKDNPLVQGDPNIRHYAGIPLKTPTGHNIGTLCVIDSQPGNLSKSQRESLKALGEQVISLLELRMKTKMLLQSKTQNDNFFELSLDLLCVASIDGYFKKLSPAFETILGYKEQDLLAKPFADFIHPDDVEDTFKEVEKLSEGATTIDFVNRYRAKNGEYRSFSWRAAPDTDTGLLYAMARDVTDNLQQQRNNKAELKAINNSVIRMELSPDGKILKANIQLLKLLGFEEKEIVGGHHNLLLFEEDKHSDTYQSFWEGLNKGVSQQNEFRRKTKGNNEVWIRGSYIPVIDFEGKISKVIKIAYDITEQIKADTLLKEERQRLDYVIRGTYYCLYAIKESDYGISKLEYWAWNLPIYSDLEINPQYDRMEIYGINAFEPQVGPFETYNIYFRPMSLTKALKLPKKIVSDSILIAPENITTEELTVQVNGIESKVVSIEKVNEYSRGKYMTAYLVQVIKPKSDQKIKNQSELIDGYDKITIKLKSKETNEMGMGEYFLKRIGN